MTRGYAEARDGAGSEVPLSTARKSIEVEDLNEAVRDLGHLAEELHAAVPAWSRCAQGEAWSVSMRNRSFAHAGSHDHRPTRAAWESRGARPKAVLNRSARATSDLKYAGVYAA